MDKSSLYVYATREQQLINRRFHTRLSTTRVADSLMKYYRQCAHILAHKYAGDICSAPYSK